MLKFRDVWALTWSILLIGRLIHFVPLKENQEVKSFDELFALFLFYMLITCCAAALATKPLNKMFNRQK